MEQKCNCVNALLWGQKYCDNSCEPQKIVLYTNAKGIEELNKAFKEEFERMNGPIKITNKK